MNLGQFLLLTNTPQASGGAGITIVQKSVFARSTNAATLDATLAAVNAGDTIFVSFILPKGQSTWTFNCSDSSGNSYTQVARVDGSSGIGALCVFRADAVTAQINLDVSLSISGHSISGLIAVYQLQNAGATGTPASYNQTSLQPAGTVQQTPPYDVMAGGFIFYLASAYIFSSTSIDQNVSATPTYAIDQDQGSSFISSENVQQGSALTTNAISGGVTSMAVTSTPSASYRANMIVIPVNPV